MKLKKGDNVIVTTGKDKGKKGSILKVFPLENRVLVEGVNIAKVSEKSRVRGKAGQVVERAMPLHASNVMIVDPKSGVRTRVAMKQIADKKVRFTKKTGSELN